jgi:hypothetical protein
VRAKRWVGYVHLKHTLSAGHLSRREIETATLLLLISSEHVVEAVAVKYDA